MQQVFSWRATVVIPEILTAFVFILTFAAVFRRPANRPPSSPRSFRMFCTLAAVILILVPAIAAAEELRKQCRHAARQTQAVPPPPTKPVAKAPTPPPPAK